MDKFKLPYLEKGRWYRIFIESDNTDVTITNSDLDGVEVSSKYLKMPKDFIICDSHYNIHGVSGGVASEVTKGVKIYNDGKQAIKLPEVDVFDYAYIYIFGYIGE